MRCVLPYPPSVNHYWRHVGAKVLISKEGRQYRQRVAEIVARQLAAEQSDGELPTGERLAVLIDAHVPDRRRRDLDNVQKPLLDALRGLAYQDDSQIDWLLTRRAPLLAGGLAVVTIEPLPVDRCLDCGERHTARLRREVLDRAAKPYS